MSTDKPAMSLSEAIEIVKGDLELLKQKDELDYVPYPNVEALSIVLSAAEGSRGVSEVSIKEEDMLCLVEIVEGRVSCLRSRRSNRKQDADYAMNALKKLRDCIRSLAPAPPMEERAEELAKRYQEIRNDVFISDSIVTPNNPIEDQRRVRTETMRRFLASLKEGK